MNLAALIILIIMALTFTIFPSSASIVSYMPLSPTSITSTTGNFYINTTWQAGAGNVTDSYNVSEGNSSLIGFWAFDNSSGTFSPDISSVGNAVSCWNGTVNEVQKCTWVTGKYGNAVSIPANQSVVLTVVNGNNSIYNPRNQITAGGWFNISDKSYLDGYPALIDKGDNNGYYLYLDSAHSSGNVMHVGLTFKTTSNTAFIGYDSTWNTTHMIYFTYDGITLKLYEDSVLKAKQALSGQLADTTNNSLFFMDGNAQPVPSLGLSGGIAGWTDEIGIWNRSFTQNEISTVYSNSPYTNNNIIQIPNDILSLPNLFSPANGSITGLNPMSYFIFISDRFR